MLLQKLIELKGACSSFFGGTEHLDLIGADAHIFGQPCGAKLGNGLGSLFFRGGADKEKVAFYIFQLRQNALIDPVGVHNDQALLRLPENLSQPDGRKDTAAEHIAERKTGANRGQLIRVAYKNHPSAGADGLKQMVQKFDINHRHFVDDHSVGLQGILGIPLEKQPAGARLDAGFQKPVDGGSILPGDLGQPLGGTARGGAQKGFQAQLIVQRQNALDNGGYG